MRAGKNLIPSTVSPLTKRSNKACTAASVCVWARIGHPQGEASWCKEIRDFYGEDASEELDCIPKNGGGKWLNRALIESRMTPYTPVIRYDQTDDFGLLPEPRRAAEVADWIADTLQPLLDSLDKPSFLL